LPHSARILVGLDILLRGVVLNWFPFCRERICVWEAPEEVARWTCIQYWCSISRSMLPVPQVESNTMAVAHEAELSSVTAIPES